MELLTGAFEREARPADHYIRVLTDISKCFSVKNLCIQHEYERCVNTELFGKNVLKRCYERSRTNMSEYGHADGVDRLAKNISVAPKAEIAPERGCRLERFSDRCPRILDADATIDMLLTTKRSIARFGDGEMFVAFNGMSLSFQSYNDNLALNLREILAHPTDACAVALPYPYFYRVDNLRKECKRYIEDCFYGRMESGGMMDGFRYDVDYYDTSFGTFYHHCEFSEDESLGRFERIKDIFRKKNIILVTGDSRIEGGYAHNIFDDADTNVEIVHSEPKNAFMKYASLRKSVVEKSDGRLVIAICGPCATVLAYDLSNNYGIRCLDMGHFAREYDFLMSGKIPYSTNREPLDFFTT